MMTFQGPAVSNQPVPQPKIKPNTVQKPSLGGRPSGATFFEAEGAVPVTWSTSDIKQARSKCSKFLKGLDITYKMVPAIGGPNGCGAPAPIEVEAVAGVKITPPATLTCRFASVLTKWMRGALQQAAAAAMQDQVTSLTNVASYTCRPVRAATAQRLSEHALSNALDISAITLVRTGTVTISSDWRELPEQPPAQTSGTKSLDPKALFLRYLHESACEVFSTVLGPDHNVWHKDHLHLDHGRGGRYGLCQ